MNVRRTAGPGGTAGHISEYLGSGERNVPAWAMLGWSIIGWVVVALVCLGAASVLLTMLSGPARAADPAQQAQQARQEPASEQPAPEPRWRFVEIPSPDSGPPQIAASEAVGDDSVWIAYLPGANGGGWRMMFVRTDEQQAAALSEVSVVSSDGIKRPLSSPMACIEAGGAECIQNDEIDGKKQSIIHFMLDDTDRALIKETDGFLVFDYTEEGGGEATYRFNLANTRGSMAALELAAVDQGWTGAQPDSSGPSIRVSGPCNDCISEQRTRTCAEASAEVANLRSEIAQLDNVYDRLNREVEKLRREIEGDLKSLKAAENRDDVTAYNEAAETYNTKVKKEAQFVENLNGVANLYNSRLEVRDDKVAWIDGHCGGRVSRNVLADVCREFPNGAFCLGS